MFLIPQGGAVFDENQPESNYQKGGSTIYTCWKCGKEMPELENDVWRVHKSGDRSRKVAYFCFNCFTCVEVKTIEYVPELFD